MRKFSRSSETKVWVSALGSDWVEILYPAMQRLAESVKPQIWRAENKAT
jgi:hypothetical protein